MASKRPSGSRQTARRRRPSRPRPGSPEGWIRIIFVEKVGRVQKLRLRLKPRRGKARSIALVYARTKRALGRGKA